MSLQGLQMKHSLSILEEIAGGERTFISYNVDYQFEECL